MTVKETSILKPETVVHVMYRYRLQFTTSDTQSSLFMVCQVHSKLPVDGVSNMSLSTVMRFIVLAFL